MSYQSLKFYSVLKDNSPFIQNNIPIDTNGSIQRYVK